MARSFPTAKTVSAFISNEISAVFSRRGYAATSQSSVLNNGRTGAPNMMLKKGSEEPAKTPWVPDPVTGYYRPENIGKTIDAAQLREMLIKTKTTPN